MGNVYPVLNKTWGGPSLTAHPWKRVASLFGRCPIERRASLSLSHLFCLNTMSLVVAVINPQRKPGTVMLEGKCKEKRTVRYTALTVVLTLS